MIIDKTLEVLHFEDDSTTRYIVKESLKRKFGATVKQENSLINLDIYLRTRMLDRFDLLIFDWCMPVYPIDGFLPLMAKCDKPILFYTCLDYDDWAQRVTKILGRIPDNFKFNRKAYDDIIKSIWSIL